MTPQEYYRLTGPTALAGPPQFYSPTALASLRKCPLQWQMKYSAWGDSPRHPGTPNKKRIAGSVIHDLLEAMFRHLGRAGRPPRGSEAFRAAMRSLDVGQVLRGLIDRAENDWSNHPRTKGSPLSLDAGDIRKRAFHTFRASYRPSTAKSNPTRTQTAGMPLGSEVPVEDEELRLRGRVDLARPAELVEFKTGAPSPDHERQLELYALVWSRQRGVFPKLTLVYPGESRSWPTDADRLEGVRQTLADDVAEFDAALQQEAPAHPGDHCRYCPVRSFCDPYWEEPLPGDRQFIVAEAPSAHAIGDGDELIGLHSAHVASSGKVEIGDRVRLLGVQSNGDELILPPWGELFVHAGPAS